MFNPFRNKEENERRDKKQERHDQLLGKCGKCGNDDISKEEFKELLNSDNFRSDEYELCRHLLSRIEKLERKAMGTYSGPVSKE